VINILGKSIKPLCSKQIAVKLKLPQKTVCQNLKRLQNQQLLFIEKKKLKRIDGANTKPIPFYKLKLNFNI